LSRGGFHLNLNPATLRLRNSDIEMDRKKRLKKICQQYNISLVYLFGSNLRPGLKMLNGVTLTQKIGQGDLDLGVVFEVFPFQETRKVYGFIYEGLCPLFRPLELDLVFLQETDYLLQFEAIKGRNIFSSSRDFKDRYEEIVMSRAADWKFEYEVFQREFLDSIRNGYFEFEYEPDSR